jgi:glycosyltransferase involved in cell wall biosynthesis
MEFTFGIITSDHTAQHLISVINQIKAEVPEDKREIIVVGGIDPKIEGVIHIAFDESQKPMWITRKKNLVTQHSTKENIVYLHDYIGFESGWYEGQLKKGNDFSIRMDRIINFDGTRFRDWSLWPHNGGEIDSIVGHECLLPYHIAELSKFMYISGTYWIAKRSVMLKHPLNEELVWGQGEDVEWSKIVRQEYDFQMNEHSAVRILKPGKDRAFREIQSSTLAQVLMHTAPKTRFKIVIPSYNNSEWCEYNVASIANQNYDNYEVLYIDDASTDDTYDKVCDMVSGLSNWKVISNKSNMRRGYNISPFNENLTTFLTDDEDVLVFVDGDDWLIDDDVLLNLHKYYVKHKPWMTYGGMYCYPSNQAAHPQNTQYPDSVHNSNSYRHDVWRASHLRTFKWWLYQKIEQKDLIHAKTGEYYFHAEDLATSFPCLEMCPKNKIGVLDFPAYVFNETDSNRARGVKRELDAGPVLENEIRSIQPYTRMQSDKIVTAALAGGLGNMMFQIATGYSTAKDLSREFKLYIKMIDGIAHRSPAEYMDSIFKNLTEVEDVSNAHTVQERSFDYDETAISELANDSQDLIVRGCFQSYKYFQKHEEDIRELFKPSPAEVEKILALYNPTDAVSLHVRRGDYLKLSDHHYNLKIDYYHNAIDYFQGAKFLVFSDDIDWCKSVFKGDNFTFVEGLDDATSLYLMSLCNHSIIANSTFSWWGAWLNANRDKVVVYPNKWFGPANAHLNTSDLFPDEWICLEEASPELEVNLIDNACRHLAKSNGRYSTIHGRVSSKMKFVRDVTNYKGITIFTDECLNNGAPQRIESDYKIGWLMEPRQVQPQRYNEIDSYINNFDFIMTHDELLLTKYPDKTKRVVVGGSWINPKNYRVGRKTKDISMIYSNKQDLEGHRLRHAVAARVNNVDLFGRGTARPLEHKEDSLLDYRFSIVIENSRAKDYFTEKLVDSLVVGTIPIYWGCTNVGEYFDPRGMYVVNSLEEIVDVVGKLTEKDYIDKIQYVKANCTAAQNYAAIEDWMYTNIIKPNNFYGLRTL